jgi:hypothetical protein
MPTAIATTISAKCRANFLPLRPCSVDGVSGCSVGAEVAPRVGAVLWVRVVLNTVDLRGVGAGEGQGGRAAAGGVAVSWWVWWPPMPDGHRQPDGGRKACGAGGQRPGACLRVAAMASQPIHARFRA